MLHGGKQIELYIPKDDSPKRKLVYPLKVLFEDDHLAVIHKPAGILVSGNNFKTMAKALEQNIRKSNLPDATIPQPVHRLDYATTGILLVGKTSSSIRALNKLFEKEVKKIYYVFTIGEMNPRGKITTEIDGKKSESEYTITKLFPQKNSGNSTW